MGNLRNSNGLSKTGDHSTENKLGIHGSLLHDIIYENNQQNATYLLTYLLTYSMEQGPP
jgi:hypothetical protein